VRAAFEIEDDGKGSGTPHRLPPAPRTGRRAGHRFMPRFVHGGRADRDANVTHDRTHCPVRGCHWHGVSWSLESIRGWVTAARSFGESTEINSRVRTLDPEHDRGGPNAMVIKPDLSWDSTRGQVSQYQTARAVRPRPRGEGTRMRSGRPRCCTRCGPPMVLHVVAALAECRFEPDCRSVGPWRGASPRPCRINSSPKCGGFGSSGCSAAR